MALQVSKVSRDWQGEEVVGKYLRISIFGAVYPTLAVFECWKLWCCRWL